MFVVELFANKARLVNGENIEFEKVVLASGSRYPTLPLAKSDKALSLDQRNIEMTKYNQTLTNADNVLIIGGGVVGVELAGEIAFAIPNANVTLAHNTDNLLNGFSSKAQDKAHYQLKDLGVNIKLNSNYQKHEKSYKDAKSGHLLTPDIVFETTGSAPSNEYLKPHLSHLLNEKGLVNVDNKLRVIGQDNFFALGDIADVKEAKLGYLAVEQGKYLAKAIANEVRNKPTKAYKTNSFMALVPTGQKTGIVQLPFATTSWRALVNLKQKDLFISKTYKGFE